MKRAYDIALANVKIGEAIDVIGRLDIDGWGVQMNDLRCRLLLLKSKLEVLEHEAIKEL